MVKTGENGLRSFEMTMTMEEKLTNGFACGGIMRVKRDEKQKKKKRFIGTKKNLLLSNLTK